MKSPIDSICRSFTVAMRLVVVSVVLQTVLLALADSAEIRIEISNEQPQVAEAFWLTVKVAAKENASVVFPDVPETIGPFNVLSHRDWFDVPEGKYRTWTRNFELESLQGGELEIPPVEVSVDGQTKASQSISFEISSLVEAEASPRSFRDIKPHVDIPAEPIQETNWLLWAIAGTLLATSLAVTAWVFYRRPGLSPSYWALQELETLRSAGEFRQANAQDVSAKMANVARQYVERRFDIRATRQTTDEFLAIAQNDARLSDSQQALLKEFLQHADEIKFAQVSPEEGRIEESYRIVQNFVRSSAGDTK